MINNAPRPAYYTPVWPPGNSPNGISTYVSNCIESISGLVGDTAILCGSIDYENVNFRGKKPDLEVDLCRFDSYISNTIGKTVAKLKPGFEIYYSHAMCISRAVKYLHQEHGINVFEMEETFGWMTPSSKHNSVLCVTRLHGPHFLVNGGNKFGDSLDDFRISREKIAIECSNLVTSPSQYTLERTREYYGLNLDNAVVIPNVAKKVQEKDYWQSALAEPQSILFVGRFDYVKGGDIAIEVFAKLCHKYPEMKLYFAGPDVGIETEAGKFEKISTYISRVVPSIHRHRIVVLGSLAPEQILTMRKKAEVTLITSRFESFGYNALEAMSVGCPTVSADAGGLSEQFQDGFNALVAESGVVDSFVDRVEYLFNNVDIAAELGKNAVRHVRQLFSPEKVAEQTYMAYRREL